MEKLHDFKKDDGVYYFCGPVKSFGKVIKANKRTISVQFESGQVLHLDFKLLHHKELL
jgi:hypothetical protein